MLFAKAVFVLLGTGLIAAQGDTRQISFEDPRAQGDIHQMRFGNPRIASDCKIDLGGGTKPFGIRDLLDGVMDVVGEFQPEIGQAYSYASKIYDFLDGVISPRKDNIIDIWDCIRADVEALVDEKIEAEAYKVATERLAGITKDLKLYQCMFYHWAHNTTDPCTGELPGAYGIGAQAMVLFNLLEEQVPWFGSVVQKKPLLPYFVFVATLHFSVAADILEYGDEWEIKPEAQYAVRDVSRADLKDYSKHVTDVLNSEYIGACVAKGYDACSDVYREIMDGSVNLVPTWPIIASFGLFSRSGVVIHNSHHMMSHGPGLDGSPDSGPVWLTKDLINSILFDESRIYEQTSCTSPDDIEF
ncbi:hypothetical protein BGX26_007212, partial [Mortierella sp. AD094]